MWHFFVLTTFWRNLWSLGEQMHGNVESLYGIEQKDNNRDKKGILVKKITFEFLVKKSHYLSSVENPISSSWLSFRYKIPSEIKIRPEILFPWQKGAQNLFKNVWTCKEVAEDRLSPHTIHRKFKRKLWKVIQHKSKHLSSRRNSLVYRHSPGIPRNKSPVQHLFCSK